MRLKIFSCHHVDPGFRMSGGIYETLHFSASAEQQPRSVMDIYDRNVIDLQKFSELRHQYYVWKEVLPSLDYVGFEHYRRPFFIDPLPLETLERDYPLVADIRRTLLADRNLPGVGVDSGTMDQFNAMRSAMSDADRVRVADWIGDHDIVFTYPIFEDTSANFVKFHNNARVYWDEFYERTMAYWPAMFGRDHVGWPAPWSGYLNMYIMRADLFDEYMELLFSSLLALDRQFPEAPGRIWGYMSERMFGAFVIQKATTMPLLRWKTLPHLFLDPAK